MVVRFFRIFIPPFTEKNLLYVLVAQEWVGENFGEKIVTGSMSHRLGMCFVSSDWKKLRKSIFSVVRVCFFENGHRFLPYKDQRPENFNKRRILYFSAVKRFTRCVQQCCSPGLQLNQQNQRQIRRNNEHHRDVNHHVCMKHVVKVSLVFEFAQYMVLYLEENFKLG